MALHVADTGRVRVLTLDRPAAMNAFNSELYDALASALADAATNDGVAVCVLTGTGSGFCAGQDLTEFPVDGIGAQASESRFVPFADALQRFDKPLIAAVNGTAVGLGFTMLLHCDIVLVSENARLRAPFVSFGIVPELGSTALLPDLVGTQTAAHLFFTGNWMSAREAVECGLAWRLCPPETLLAQAMHVASEMANAPTSSLVATKRLLLAARSDAVCHARSREEAENLRLLASPAARDALTALAKRRS